MPDRQRLGGRKLIDRLPGHLAGHRSSRDSGQRRATEHQLLNRPGRLVGRPGSHYRRDPVANIRLIQTGLAVHANLTSDRSRRGRRLSPNRYCGQQSRRRYDDRQSCCRHRGLGRRQCRNSYLQHPDPATAHRGQCRPRLASSIQIRPRAADRS
ncbi:MAG: hypothetical protein M3Y42_17380 [Actinomycetota bacterium]|nr:hypothetical protein [Actinomycetota bacterium]